MSLGTPSTYPGRHVARDLFPQRHVAWERLEMSMGIVVNVVVMAYPSEYEPFLESSKYSIWRILISMDTSYSSPLELKGEKLEKKEGDSIS
ncbi:hypothetical protein Tco_0005194 [Tanacetum coccineum]